MKNRYLNMIGIASILFSIFSLVALYPGAMTWDSLDQLRQARAGTFSDWQPPAMAFVWSLFLNLNDGPGAMLIFHLTLLWATSLTLYKWCIREGYQYGFIFLIIPILPWIMNFQFVLWKDVGMAYSWGLSVAICLYFRNHKKFPITAATLAAILFFYGALVRSNSLGAGVILMAFICTSIFKLNSIRSSAGFMILGIVTIILAHLSAGALLNVKKANPVSYVLFDDVVALKIESIDIPLSFLSQEDMQTIENCEYLQAHEIGAAFCIPDEKFTEITTTHYTELKTAWLTNVPQHFSTYAKFRLNAFFNLIRSPSSVPYYYSEFSVKNKPFTVSSGNREPSPQELAIKNYVMTSHNLMPDLFKPYSWMILSLGLILAFCLPPHLRKTSLWLLPLSGFVYIISYLPITPASDFRYAYWLCFITTLSLGVYVNIKSKKVNVPLHPQQPSHPYKPQ